MLRAVIGAARWDLADHPGLSYRFAFSDADQVSDFAVHADDRGAC